MSERIDVLLVEDHQMFADALELLLETELDIEGFRKAGSAEDGLAACQERCPDMVLMDVDLPGMDGIEATGRVLETCPDTHVVIITGLQSDRVLAGGIAAGANGFVPKTQAADELMGVLRRAAAGEIVLPHGDVTPLLRSMQTSATLDEPGARLARLTPREIEILQSLAEGRSTEEVAETLFISPRTVYSHVGSILPKLGVRSKLEAVVMALRHGVISVETRGRGA
ncbi:MAG: response regulator transcription factor [Actinomycetota bacterium]